MPSLELASDPQHSTVPAGTAAGAGESSDSPPSIPCSFPLSVVLSDSAGARSKQQERCHCKQLFIRNSGFRTVQKRISYY